MQYYQHNKYDYTYTEYVKNLLDAEIKEKFLYIISLIPNLETAPKAPPKPTNIIFKSIIKFIIIS